MIEGAGFVVGFAVVMLTVAGGACVAVGVRLARRGLSRVLPASRTRPPMRWSED